MPASLDQHTITALPILLQERSGIRRSNEPVTVGIPLPQGAAFDPARLTLWSPDHGPLPLQTQVLAFWSDKSIQWVLLDFQGTVEAHQTMTYHLRYAAEPGPYCQSPQIRLHQA